MKKWITAVAAALLTGFAAAENATNIWKGVTGRWADGGNWENGVVPDKTDMVLLPPGTYTITVDGDAECLCLRSNTTPSGSKSTVTFTGGGTLTCYKDASGPTASSYITVRWSVYFRNITVTTPYFSTHGASLYVAEGADFHVTKWFYTYSTDSNIVVDGGKLTVDSYIDLRKQANFIVKKGEFVMNGLMRNSDGGYSSGLQVLVTGGILRNAKFTFTKPATVKLSGGTLELREMIDNTTLAQTVTEFTGGTLVVNDGAFDWKKHAGWIPQNGTLVLNDDAYTALTLSDASTLSLDGMKVFVTNGVPSGAFDGIQPVPDGSIYANWLYANGTGSVETAALNIGNAIRFANKTSRLNFPYGQTFRAYGDWSSVNNNGSTYLYGDVTADTTDCLDGETPRKMTLGRVFFDQAVDYRVTGCGTNAFEIGKTPALFHSISVDPGATLEFIGHRYVYTSTSGVGLGTIFVPSLTLGAGSVLKLNAAQSTIQAASCSVDPTARIVIDMPSSPTAGKLHQMLFVGDGSDLSAQTALSGAGASGWNLKSSAGVLYLADGNQAADYVPENNTTNDWTGADGGNFSCGDNWAKGVPSSSTEEVPTKPEAVILRFPCAVQTVVTNDIEDFVFSDGAKGIAINSMQFPASAGPYEIHGNRIRFCAQASTTRDSPVYSGTPFPVVFHAPVYKAGVKFGIVTDGGSFVQFSGEVDAPTADLYLRGAVNFGGEARFRGIYFKEVYNANPSRITVVNGGRFYASGYDSLLKTSDQSSSQILVCEGGSFIYDGVWEASKSLAYSIDGYFAASNTFKSAQNATFYGTGTAYFGGAAPATDAAKKAIFSGTMTLAMGGDWLNVSAAQPDAPFTLDVTSGNLTLASAADWSYGIPDGVETTTDAAARAISVEKGATLTLGATPFTAMFHDTIAGEGTLVFADGAKIALGGALKAAAHPKTGGWTTLATVGSVSGMPYAPAYNFRVVDNGDGTVSFQMRQKAGVTISFR